MNLTTLFEKLQDRRRTAIGYPLDQTPFPMEHILRFVGLLINNLGDPWVGGTYGVNTFEIEREVLKQVGNLLNLTDPLGYVTSCGTEGNIRGITNGFQRYPRAHCYASDCVHYSVDKACNLSNRLLIKIPSNDLDEIDVDDLYKQLKEEETAVVCLTAGTVMSGAIDDVRAAVEAVNQAGVRAYIHVDAALSGFLLPPLRNRMIGIPIFDFSIPEVDSLSISGHKMLGTPFPSGVFLSRKSEGKHITYIDSTDTTIGGSRCGMLPLLIWYALKHHDLVSRSLHCLENARYAHEVIQGSTRISQWSNMVVFKKPRSKEIIEKWQLAVQGNDAHIICMPHVTQKLIDEFVNDLEKEGGYCRVVAQAV